MNATPGLKESDIPRLGRGVRLKHDAVRDAWVLLAPERMFALEGPGIEIIRRVDGEKTVAAIADDLAASFDAERARILADVLEFLDALMEKRAIDR